MKGNKVVQEVKLCMTEYFLDFRLTAMICHCRDGERDKEGEDRAQGRDVEGEGTRVDIVSKDIGHTLEARDRGVAWDRVVRGFYTVL